MFIKFWVVKAWALRSRNYHPRKIISDVYVDDRHVSPLFLFNFQNKESKYRRRKGRNDVTYLCHAYRLVFRISKKNTSQD